MESLNDLVRRLEGENNRLTARLYEMTRRVEEMAGMKGVVRGTEEGVLEREV